MSATIYKMITEQIIERLENGTIPWRKPFAHRPAVNWTTGKLYRGINNLLLDGGEYATFKQIQKHGGKVKKGEKSQIVVFWKLLEKTEKDDNGEEREKKIPLLRYYRVFEINTQCEGLESKREAVDENHNPIEESEQIVNGYENPPKLSHVAGRAYYRPSDDLVNVPQMSEFTSAEKYYSVLFHELVHSTGHLTRLNREGIVNNNGFGSEVYSKEELVAEVGASMLCAMSGIEQDTLDNSASYIKNWLEVLRDDHKMIVQASQQAQRACDWIIGKSFEKEGEADV